MKYTDNVETATKGECLTYPNFQIYTQVFCPPGLYLYTILQKKYTNFLNFT